MSEELGLSPRQKKILVTIQGFSAENGYPPSIRQMGEAANISSTSVVKYNLDILTRQGFITRARDVSRGIRLTEKAERALALEIPDVAEAPVRVPMLGYIAAGVPLPLPDSHFAQTDAEEERYIEVPPSMVKHTDQVYALRVRGTSMIDALIDSGDIVLLRYQPTAETGDMVAARLTDEQGTTLKRYYWDKGRGMVRLQPANSQFEPILVEPGRVEIQGKVIGVIRRLG